jgi:hypothetical protein
LNTHVHDSPNLIYAVAGHENRELCAVRSAAADWSFVATFCE